MNFRARKLLRRAGYGGFNFRLSEVRLATPLFGRDIGKHSGTREDVTLSAIVRHGARHHSLWRQRSFHDGRPRIELCLMPENRLAAPMEKPCRVHWFIYFLNLDRRKQ